MTTISTRPTTEFLAFQAAVAGRYSLERELGRGGMGIVFLAREVALDRMVALKLLPAAMAADAEVRERFLREARTAARLSHPHIVPIYAVDEVGGHVFFAMAHVKGGTLAERIHARGPLSPHEGVRVLREVAWALGHAHLHGVVHRDVKPENILLEEGTGRAMVSDFGIAVVMGGANGATAGEVQGTAEFMSPEQARGGDVDARSDLYSLGCVAWYTLSGRVPFTGPTPVAILGQHVSQAAPPLLSVAPYVPAGVAAAVDRCLRKEPDRRFSGADALAEALAPEAQAERELPVPLRVFIKRSREWETPVAWSALGLVFVGPIALAVLRNGGGLDALPLLAVLLALIGLPVGLLLRSVRQLLRSGFTRDDATSAFALDIGVKDEEFRFQVGQRRTPADTILRWLKRVGYGVAAGTLAIAIETHAGAGMYIGFTWSFLTGLSAQVLEEIRARHRGDVMGERWLRVWKGWLGKGIFKLSGLGLKRTEAPAMGLHRATEVALGIAADRLFEELPKETRKALKGLPETVKSLEDDARAMRQQVAELDAVLAEIGDDDSARPGAEERRRVRSGVEATRNDAREKLQQAVKALETIRLGLLLMHGGAGTVESLTLDLEKARDVSEHMENLLSGHREVERLLRERRETGVIRIDAVPRSAEG